MESALLSDPLTGVRDDLRASCARLLVSDPDVPAWARLVHVMNQINEALLDAATGQLLLHAGGVALPSGGAVIICGPSGSGKTTLTLGLVVSGLAYLTDEAIVLDPVSLRLSPYRKPVMLKAGSQALFPHLRPEDEESAGGTWVLAPESFDVTPLPAHPVLPALLLFPMREAGAPCGAERISEAEAAYLAGSESFRLSEVEAGPLAALARLARRTPAYRLRYDHLHDAVRIVHDLVTAA